MKPWWSLALWAPLVLVAQGCGGTLYMREARPDEILIKPPAGKVLVNFHRPSDYKADRLYVIFDRGELIGVNRGEERFQYVCDPGQRVFVGYLKDGVWATVSVIQADLAADRVYDCVVDSGYFTSSIAVRPLKKGAPRRAQLSAWEEALTVMALDPTSGFRAWAAGRRKRNEAIVKEVLQDPGERLERLAQDDHR